MRQGTRLEVNFDGDWWEAQIVRAEDTCIRIHYEGGDEDEDEWVAKCSDRLRPPQHEGDSERLCSSKSPKSPGRVVPFTEDRDVDGHRDAGMEHRPVRKSRMMSDDARLALQLQEEEVRAARGMAGFFHRRGSQSSHPSKRAKTQDTPCVSAAQVAKQPTKDLPADAALPKIKTVPEKKAQPKTGSRVTADATRDLSKAVAANTPRRASAAESSSASSPSTVTKARRAKPAKLEEKSGAVSFFIFPDESSSEVIPTIKRTHMTLMEDMTVFHVKRQIIDEVLPGLCATQIDIRTSSGMLLGQDHSLRYVRTILWPRCNGDLVLKYSLSKRSLI